MRFARRLGRSMPDEADEATVAAARRDLRDLEHLRLVLAFTLAPESNCVDVGAHQGTVLGHMLHYAPEGKHIAHEPLPASTPSSQSTSRGRSSRCSRARRRDDRGTTPAAVHDHLRELGLRIFDVDGNGPLEREELEASFTRGEIWTYVAHAGVRR